MTWATDHSPHPYDDSPDDSTDRVPDDILKVRHASGDRRLQVLDADRCEKCEHGGENPELPAQRERHRSPDRDEEHRVERTLHLDIRHRFHKRPGESVSKPHERRARRPHHLTWRHRDRDHGQSGDSQEQNPGADGRMRMRHASTSAHSMLSERMRFSRSLGVVLRGGHRLDDLGRAFTLEGHVGQSDLGKALDLRAQNVGKLLEALGLKEGKVPTPYALRIGASTPLASLQVRQRATSFKALNVEHSRYAIVVF